MRFRRMRYLTCFLAALFVASNATAAIRACAAVAAGPGHAAVRALDAAGDEQLCPQSEDTARCLAHCAQSYRIDQQNFFADVHAVAPAPCIAAFVHAPSQAKPKVVALAVAAPVGGPPLTILFGNFRN